MPPDRNTSTVIIDLPVKRRNWQQINKQDISIGNSVHGIKKGKNTELFISTQTDPLKIISECQGRERTNYRPSV